MSSNPFITTLLRRMVFGSAALICAAPTGAQERANFFNDPFLQVTQAIADCPTPPGPLITQSEMQAQAHSRIERGTSCFQSGKCRLPNSYLYDREIIPRVRKAILTDGRFNDSSIWVEGQRRWVRLQGCVRRPADAAALEQLVRNLDDVEAVINQLTVRAR